VSLHVDGPILYLITKGDATPANFVEKSREILDVIRLAVEERAALVQIREKQLTARLLFELTRKAVELTRGSATRLLVNDRADIALAAGADGVHLAANSLPVSVIRKNFPGAFIIGTSTHSLDSARAAAEQGADLVVFGPVFATPGKGEPLGIAALSNVCQELRPFPVIALGGVNETNYRSVLEAGASGFAAIRSLHDSDKLRSISRELRK